jgi:hypothetical protein
MPSRIGDALHWYATYTPNKVAIVSSSGALTYAGLWARVCQKGRWQHTQWPPGLKITGGIEKAAAPALVSVAKREPAHLWSPKAVHRGRNKRHCGKLHT